MLMLEVAGSMFLIDNLRIGREMRVFGKHSLTTANIALLRKLAAAVHLVLFQESIQLIEWFTNFDFTR